MVSAAPSPAPAARPGTAPGVLLLLGSCCSLQVGAAFAVRLFPVMGSWGVTSLRLGIAAVVLLLAVRPSLRGWTRAQWLPVLAFGLALAGMNGSFYAAISRIPLGTAVAVEFLGPLTLAAVLSRKAVDFLWVLLALAGMGVLAAESLTGAAALDPVGVAWALVAGVFWAAYVLTSARVGQAVPGTGGLAVALCVATVVLLPVGGPAALAAFASPGLLGVAFMTALLASVVPYTLELAALRRLPQAVFSILLSLEPAVAALFGWLLLGQAVSALRLLAIALVILASMGTTLTAYRAARRRREPAALTEESGTGAGEGLGQDADRPRSDAQSTAHGTSPEALAEELVAGLGTASLPVLPMPEEPNRTQQ